MPNIKFNKSLILSFLFFLSSLACAGVTKIEIISQESLSDAETDFSYENIQGIVYFSLDPLNPSNSEVTDIEHAPRNAQGNVEYSADFKLLVPSEDFANGGLLYMGNNRGSGRTPPEI